MSKRRAAVTAAVVAVTTILAVGSGFLEMRAAAQTKPVRITKVKARPNIRPALAPVKKPEPVSTKIVPIVSLGQGLRVGAAQITGPATNVRQAMVIGQIETTYQDVVRIRIFVPLKTESGIDRVPQVNVSAYGDIRL